MHFSSVIRTWLLKDLDGFGESSLNFHTKTARLVNRWSGVLILWLGSPFSRDTLPAYRWRLLRSPGLHTLYFLVSAAYYYFSSTSLYPSILLGDSYNLSVPWEFAQVHCTVAAPWWGMFWKSYRTDAQSDRFFKSSRETIVWGGTHSQRADHTSITDLTLEWHLLVALHYKHLLNRCINMQAEMPWLQK